MPSYALDLVETRTLQLGPQYQVQGMEPECSCPILISMLRSGLSTRNLGPEYARHLPVKGDRPVQSRPKERKFCFHRSDVTTVTHLKACSFARGCHKHSSGAVGSVPCGPASLAADMWVKEG